MSTRLPLATSGVENVHVIPSGKIDTVTKSREKAGAEGGPRLEREVQALKARIARRDETITQLQIQVKSSTTRSGLETQVEEIVKRHEASKAKYQSDLSKLKATNEALQKTNDEIKGNESKVLAKVSDIRSKYALAEAENKRLQKELAGRPIPQAGPSVDERLTWRKEKAAMDAEIKALKKDVEARVRREEETVRDLSSLKEMRGENERLQMGWNVLTEQYAESCDASASEKKDWRQEKQVLESDRRELDSRVDVLNVALAAKLEESKDQSDQIQQLQAERDFLSVMIDEIRADQIGYPTLKTLSLDEITPLSPMIGPSDIAHLLDLTSTHDDLIREHTSDLEPHILSLTASIMALEQSLRERTNTLTSLQSTHVRLETEYAESRLEHAPCAVTISQLRYEADQAQQITLVREEGLGEVRSELRGVEEKYQRQAELVVRANENEARSKFALESLEEEIVHLQNKYHEFAGYEEKYEELLERQAILEARETVAIEEAERLSMQNSELMGHTNGSQRIGYVDNVRREMVLCKHELASTRHLLNAANDRIRALESEISAYRSISPDLGLGQSRTRVVRRQPEGSHLTSSVSAGRREVSGLGGARKFI